MDGSSIINTIHTVTIIGVPAVIAALAFLGAAFCKELPKTDIKLCK